MLRVILSILESFQSDGLDSNILAKLHKFNARNNSHLIINLNWQKPSQFYDLYKFFRLVLIINRDSI